MRMNEREESVMSSGHNESLEAPWKLLALKQVISACSGDEVTLESNISSPVVHRHMWLIGGETSGSGLPVRGRKHKQSFDNTHHRA
jgi:hypothetical protein